MNRLQERKLRNLISETVQKTLRRRLKEDTAGDVAKTYKSGPGSVRSFVDSGPKDLKDVLQGDFDGNPDDDKISVGSPSMVDVGGLKATQSEIDLMKSVGFPLGGFEALKGMITSNTSSAEGSITISGDLVLDGHHRWSGVVGICGPSGQISAQNLGIPGSDKEKLAASQLAIAAYMPAGQKMPSASDAIPYNILGANSGKIKKMILDNVGKKTDKRAPGPLLNDEMIEQCSKDDVIANWAGFEVGASPEEVKEAIATKVGENLSTLQKGDAPKRADMPQFDDESIGGSKAKVDIYAGMESGDFNILPPFNKTQKESAAKNGFVLERWQKLAGLIKG